MRIVLSMIVLFCACNLQAQNLIANGSFEEVENCFTIIEAQVSGWYNPIVTSPDVYFSNTSCLNEYAVEPQDGNNYLGLAVGIPDLSSFDSREYVTTELLAALESGKIYRLSFWIRESPFLGFTCDKIGVYFSNDSISESTEDLFSITPQIQTPNNMLFIGGDWIEYIDYYEAQGGEKFMTIGNFVPSSELAFHYHFVEGTNAVAYYDFDNFNLIEVEGNNVNEIDEAFSLFPNPSADLVYFESAKQIESIQIISVGGLILLTEKKVINEIDTRSIPSGIYLVRILTSDGELIHLKLNIVR